MNTSEAAVQEEEVEEDLSEKETVIALPSGPVEVENAGGEAAYDAVSSAKAATLAPKVDVKGLSLNEKYALILAQVKATGPVFFVQVNPNTFGLPDNDPLNLIWINMLTSWKLATTILSQFEVNMIGQQALIEEGAKKDDTDATDSETDTQETAGEPHVHIAADAEIEAGEDVEAGDDALTESEVEDSEVEDETE